MSAVGIVNIDICLFYKLLFLYFLCRINVEIAVTTAYCLTPKMFDYGKYYCRNREKEIKKQGLEMRIKLWEEIKVRII